MTYERPEALEVGTAVEVILGAKDEVDNTDDQFLRTFPPQLDETYE